MVESTPPEPDSETGIPDYGLDEPDRTSAPPWSPAPADPAVYGEVRDFAGSGRATEVDTAEVDTAAASWAAASSGNGTHQALAEADPWEAYASPVGAGASAAGALWPWGLRGLAETLEVVGLALLMFVLVRGVAQNFVVDGGSMEPNFSDGQMLIVNKLAYRSFDISWLPWSDNEAWRPFGTPDIGDVVVFRFPLDPSRDFIKRIIAVPGQTVEIRDGHVIVDGQVLQEDYIADVPRYSFAPQTVPEGHVFVLGDARNNSFDSHQWGMLSREFIIGRAELRYWPFGEFGVAGHEHPKVVEPGFATSP